MTSILRVPLLLLVVGATLLAGGCATSTSTPAPPPRGAARALEAPPAAVIPAARRLLEQEFGGVTVEEGAWSLRSAAREFETSRDTGNARELVGARSTLRRIAWFSATPRGDGTLARLRVDVERQDFDRREGLSVSDGRLSDTPGEQTALVRQYEPTTSGQTVWTPLRRDLRLERELLSALEAEFNRAAPDAPPSRINAAPAASRPAATPEPMIEMTPVPAGPGRS